MKRGEHVKLKETGEVFVIMEVKDGIFHISKLTDKAEEKKWLEVTEDKIKPYGL